MYRRWKKAEFREAMEYHSLHSRADFDQLLAHSQQNAVLLFKHSTRCPISAGAWSRFQRDYRERSQAPDVYYLDVIEQRSLAREIAQDLGIEHQSPQLLLIDKSQCLRDASHSAIDLADFI